MKTWLLEYLKYGKVQLFPKNLVVIFIIWNSLNVAGWVMQDATPWWELCGLELSLQFCSFKKMSDWSGPRNWFMLADITANRFKRVKMWCDMRGGKLIRKEGRQCESFLPGCSCLVTRASEKLNSNNILFIQNTTQTREVSKKRLFVVKNRYSQFYPAVFFFEQRRTHHQSHW